MRYSVSSTDSHSTLTAQNDEGNDNFMSCTEIDMSGIQVPIVGYEVMEERARFTVSNTYRQK